jgi:hypothetical protein
MGFSVSLDESNCLMQVEKKKQEPKFLLQFKVHMKRTIFWDATLTCLAYASTLNMEAVYSFETSVNIYQATWRNISEDSVLHSHCISTGSCLTILLTALISLRSTNTCLPAEELVGITALQKWWGVQRRCRNVAELTDGRLLWHGHRKTYSPIIQVPQFRRWLHWELA